MCAHRGATLGNAADSCQSPRGLSGGTGAAQTKALLVSPLPVSVRGQKTRKDWRTAESTCVPLSVSTGFPVLQVAQLSLPPAPPAGSSARRGLPSRNAQQVEARSFRSSEHALHMCVCSWPHARRRAAHPAGAGRTAAPGSAPVSALQPATSQTSPLSCSVTFISKPCSSKIYFCTGLSLYVPLWHQMRILFLFSFYKCVNNSDNLLIIANL